MSLSEILAECARIAAGSSGAGAGALASVARRHGSLPMSATAKMLVTAGGARIGTVGGGCLEAEIIERAHDVLQSRVPALSSHSLNAELAGDYGLTCGGTAEMFIEPVFADERLAAIYAEASALMARGERALMATGIDWSDGVVKALVNPDEFIGADNDLVRSAIGEFDAMSELPSLEHGVLVEPISGKPRLVVFGAGHVGARVAEAAAFAGWRVTVADDRADFADARRLPFADSVILCDFHDVLGAAQLDAETYVVIATRGHQHDVVLAGQLVPWPLRSRHARESAQGGADGESAARVGSRRRGDREGARTGWASDRRRHAGRDRGERGRGNDFSPAGGDAPAGRRENTCKWSARR